MSSFTSDQLKVSTRGIGRVQNHDITIDKYQYHAFHNENQSTTTIRTFKKVDIRKGKHKVQKGVIHIHMSINNTIITITNVKE